MLNVDSRALVMNDPAARVRRRVLAPRRLRPLPVLHELDAQCQGKALQLDTLEA
jgi:hypothetical protein